jgi:hypothetical protein
VVEPATVCTVLSVALSHDWSVHQLDVKIAFLHGTLTETVYCEQPFRFIDSAHLDYVCRLNKSLYGLKQAPRTWYNRFASHILSLGFVGAQSDTSLFIYRHAYDMTYLLLYVNDIVLTVSSTSLLRRIFAALTTEFAMKDLGSLHHFLSASVTPRNGGLFLSQVSICLTFLTEPRWQIASLVPLLLIHASNSPPVVLLCLMLLITIVSLALCST